MKHRLIGLLTAWSAEKWIKLSIEQALYYCDEVIVCIAGYTPSLKKLEDSTYDICKSFGDKIKLVDFFIVGSDVNGIRSKVLNKMLSASDLIDNDNWVWMLDYDEFFDDKCFKDIIKVIESNKFNRIFINEKFFYINMKHYLKGGHYRLSKINNIKNRFIPYQKWSGKLDPTYRVPFEKGMFHYSMLTNTKTHRARWATEYANVNQSNKIKWLDEIYYKFDINDQDKWIEKNRKLFGIKSPWFNNGFSPDGDGRLFFYGGKHPDTIENSGLIKIDDFRRVYK